MLLVWYQAAKDCSCISATGMLPGSETLQLHQCRWNVTRQRNSSAASVPLECYQAAKHCSCSSATGMVPGSETLQLQQCRWYGTRQRKTAAAEMPVVWYRAAKHCSSSSVAGMVPGNETLQLQKCRWYGSRQRNTAVPSPVSLLCPTWQCNPHGLSLSRHLTSTIHFEPIFCHGPMLQNRNNL